MKHRSRKPLVILAGVIGSACTSIFGDAFDGNVFDQCTGKADCEGAAASSAHEGGMPPSQLPDAAPGPIPRAEAGATSTMPGGSPDSGPVLHDSGPSRKPPLSPDADIGGHDGDAAVDSAPPHEGRPSCRDLASICGPRANDDCCASDGVPGGVFTMGRDMATVDAADPASAYDYPQHVVRVSSFVLDRYEVSLGRFRNFMNAYETWQLPSEGSGAMPGRPDSGWQSSWSGLLPKYGDLKMQLGCKDVGGPTWSEQRGTTEAYAMNCLTWLVSYAFCLWDGGRLPTEAEWEYAAAGGNEQRVFPWGDEYDATRGNWNELQYHRISAVGEAGAGAGRARWGQYDLAGNVWEFTRDTIAGYPETPVTDPIVPYDNEPTSYPVLRGGSWWPGVELNLTSSHRFWWYADRPNVSIGVRCARDASSLAGESDASSE